MKKIFLILVLIFLACVAYSQEEDQLLVSEIKQSTVVTQPATLNKGFLLIGSIFTYTVVDKIFLANGKKDYSTENSWAKYSTEYLHFQYGLTNRIELAFAIPYKITSISYSRITKFPVYFDSTSTTKFKLKGNGIGDIDLEIYYQLIKGSKTKPSLVGQLSATFPTGEKNPTNIKENMIYDLPTGSGETTLALKLIYRKINYPYSYSFYGTFKYSFGGDKMMLPYENSISFKTGNYYNLGGNFNFLLNDWIAVQNDLSLVYQQANKYNGQTAYFGITQYGIFYNPNISFQFKKFRLVQGVFIPLFGKSFPADPQYNIDLQYIF
jgi:hypothetical protein